MIEQHDLMERICEPSNLNRAFRQVKRNKGAAGVDEQTIAATLAYLQEGHNARSIRETLLRGDYRPQAVRGVKIPKPDGVSARLAALLQVGARQELDARPRLVDTAATALLSVETEETALAHCEMVAAVGCKRTPGMATGNVLERLVATIAQSSN